MAIEFATVVPWGRNFDEYRRMFHLTDKDLDKKIVGFGDGPASFNYEMKKINRNVISLDPVYQFSEKQLRQRIYETKDEVIRQTRENLGNFIWKSIKDVDELEKIRMQAMSLFLKDYEAGKREGRYIYHELPKQTGFPDLEFDLGLSSHFLMLYSQLGLDFHIQSISEMLRICKEIRIFPLLNLNAEESEVLAGIINAFKSKLNVKIIKVNYEFQKNGNKMLKITR